MRYIGFLTLAMACSASAQQGYHVQRTVPLERGRRLELLEERRTAPSRPAYVRIVDRGATLDSAFLERPTARLALVDSTTTGHRLYGVTVDLTADAGSYSGPYVRLLGSERHRIEWEKARDQTGAVEEIHLPSTLKTAWRLARRADGRGNDILLVACRPDFDADAHTDTAAFVITYSRFTYRNSRWEKRSRTEPGIWESDGDFPGAEHFPR